MVIERDVQTEPVEGPRARPIDNGRLEIAVDVGKLGVWEWRIAEGRVRWSETLERIHGLTPGSFEGTFEAYQRDVHPDDRDRVLAAIGAAVEEGRDIELAYRIVLPDRGVRWIKSHGRLLRDPAGQPLEYVGVCRDVTDERGAHEALARAVAAEAERAEAERARQHMSAMIDSIADPFSVLDEELRIVFANRAAAELAGREPEEVIGRFPWELTAHGGEVPFLRAYQHVLAERQPLTVEEYLAPVDSWFEASVSPLGGGISVYTRDVTARHQAAELAERIARHSALRADVSDALGDARDMAVSLRRCCEAVVRHLEVAFARLWTLDEAGTTLLLQASAGLYTHTDGGHAAVPVGKFKIGLIAQEKKPHLTNDVPHDPRIGDPAWAAREGMVAFAGYPLLVDGNLVGVLALFSRRPVPEDTLGALAGVADTIAQGIMRRRAELALEQRVAELARSNADLEQFAYVASHDLQEPLRMVSSYAQLLARRYRGRLDQDADDFIGFLVEGVGRMQQLIDDLLAYSRVGTRGSESGLVDLEQVMAGVRRNLEAALAESGGAISTDPLPTVRGDPGQLGQLLQNLVSNAIKFRGEARPEIRVSARPGPGGWTISVQDNGIGIDPQYFERIFVIFQRLHPREKYPGTGMGLAIAKKIVERHGGRIWVESRPGAGSTVSFTLPDPRARRP